MVEGEKVQGVIRKFQFFDFVSGSNGIPEPGGLVLDIRSIPRIYNYPREWQNGDSGNGKYPLVEVKGSLGILDPNHSMIELDVVVRNLFLIVYTWPTLKLAVSAVRGMMVV